MEKVRETLTLHESESALVSSIIIIPPNTSDQASFYEGFSLRGIRVDTIQPVSISCTFKVPPRFTDLSGNLSPGAIVNLVDELGWAAICADGRRMKASTDMSISFMSPAKLHDELEINAKALGHKGAYSGSYVLLRNRTTGGVVAEGRHSMFGNLRSKM